MEDDIDFFLLEPLRERTKAQVDLCEDVNLLDLVIKILLNG